MNHRVWKCEQMRAGKVTNQVTFDSEQKAEEFVSKMRQIEPDIFWRVEPVEAWRVWN